MKVALLANVTVELLADLFKPDDAVWCPPGFGAWRQVCLEPPAELRDFAPDLIAVLVEEAPSAHSGETCLRETEVGAMCERLRRAMPGTSVVRVDLTDLANEVGPRFYDARIGALSGCPWSLTGQRAIRDEILRLAAVRREPPKKVLAVDFDGVLWRGTLAEDGAAALEPSVDLQLGLLELKARGVLLVGLTKNDETDLAAVWTQPQMRLTPADFVAIRANWEPKAKNLTDVAHALNLGTEAFVFADDNPGECAAMAAAHPEVAVVPVPRPEGAFLRHLMRLYFPDFGVTEEDRLRTASYHASSLRQEAAKGLTLDEYLASLETVIDFHPAQPEEVPRLAQLSQRCNQFNVRQSRYGEDDIRRILDDPTRLAFAVSVRDRFGDLGRVAFLVVAINSGTARLEEWVMSCRAMNRRIEDETWRRLKSELRQRGISGLQAEVRPTEKNRPIHDLVFSETLGRQSRPPLCVQYSSRRATGMTASRNF